MFPKIKNFLYFIICYSGLVYISRYIYRRIFNNPIRILYTHRIINESDALFPFLKALDYFTVQEFEKKIKYLLKHYRFISLDECIKYLKDKRRPPNCIILTFDDGYKCNYTRAFPILKKYNIPATIFITTDAIDKDLLLWHDKLLFMIGRTQVTEFSLPEISKQRYKISSLKDRRDTFNDIVSRLKRVDNEEKEKILEKMMDILKINEDELKNTNLMLTWDEIREMHKSGLVSFGSHTITHPILTKVSMERAKYEIQHSKNIIEQKLGDSICFFAYPNGDYNTKIQNIVNNNSYVCACTTIEEDENTKYNLFSLGRIGFAHEPFYMFGLRMNGMFNLIRKMGDVFRNVQCWLPGYILNRTETKLKRKPQKPIHILLTICDHFEPLWEGVSKEIGLNRVKKWVEEYPKIANKYRDSDGFLPKYTFFYPIEEYEPEYLDLLAELCHKGYGEVEIHLHHNNDTVDNLRKTLIDFKKTLAFRHNLLARDKKTKEICYGFIHGNWALDNSRRDGKWCGVNNELQILRETGCCADFTLPSVPSDTQTQKVNSIYYAIDNPDNPKSHNWGIDAKKGHKVKDGFLLVQGPINLNWKKRKIGILPSIENGYLGSKNAVTPYRIKLWIESNIHIRCRSNWIFIKLHTHGCQENNMETLLGKDLDYLFSYLEKNYNDGRNYILHYVSTRETYNIIKALENKEIKDDFVLNEYRDYKLTPIFKEINVKTDISSVQLNILKS